MALAATYGLTADQGATFRQVIIWKDSTNTPVNLTGYTARMYIRERTSARTLLKSLTTSSGNVTLGGEDGTITLFLSADETKAIKSGNHAYDLELETDGGEVNRLLMGMFVVRSEVTR